MTSECTISHGREKKRSRTRLGAQASSPVKVLPQSLEAEQALLSAILIDNRTLPEILEILQPQDFYKEAHIQIFNAVVSLFTKREPIDLVTVHNQLKDSGSLDSCGGAAYISKLIDAVPAAMNPKEYARIVHEKSIVRGLIYKGHDIINQCFETYEDIDALIDFAESALFEIYNRRIQSVFVPISKLLAGNVAKIESWYQNKSLVRGLATGFKDFDRLTHGLHGSDLIILAARPGMGKTALALNIARNVALDPQLPVAVFSLEMAEEQLALRLLCSEARLSLGRLRDGFMSKDDWLRLNQATEMLHQAPIFIDDSTELTATQIRAKARRLQMEKGLGLIIIDYLQLIKVANRLDRRDLEISEISRSLKSLAKELKVPVIALSQLNRELEKRKNKRPQLSDLRESGSLEQDADLVVFIYREEAYEEKPSSTSYGKAEIILAKHRNGPTDSVRLAFLKQYTRFENLAFTE